MTKRTVIHPKNVTSFSKQNTLEKQMDDIVSKISTYGKERLKVSETLRKVKKEHFSQLPVFLLDLLLGDNIWSPIRAVDIGASNVTIAGVDGGIITKNMTGIDLGVIRAIGSMITYNRKGVQKTKYIPTRNVTPELYVTTGPFESHDFEIYTSYKRTLKEIKTAIEVLKATSYLDVLLMDGTFSLTTRSNDYKVEKVLSEIIQNLGIMHEVARLKGTLVAWIVKDTRQSKFVELLGRILPHLAKSFPQILQTDYRKVINSSRDQSFFAFLLPEGSRSFIIKEKLETDTGESQLPYYKFSYFLKVSKRDTPLRVDFLMQKDKYTQDPSQAIKHANKLASYILPVSRIHNDYSLPVPIIDADARARIDKQEFEMIIRSIQKRIQLYNVFSKKRERSPFKFK